MNNNTKVRVHISKDLFESLAKQVLAEAKKMKGGSADHAMKLSKKMPKLGENKEMVKAKKMEERAMMAKKDETKHKVMEIAKGQLAELMKKKDN
jgi:hypothetical protein